MSSYMPGNARSNAHTRIAALEAENASLRAQLSSSRAATVVAEAGHDGSRASEQRLRLILESAVDFAIITTDPEGRVTGWNAGARNILGWDEADILGQTSELFWTPEDLASGAPEAEMSTAREQGRVADERWHLRRDGRRFWASGEKTPMRNEAGALLGYLKILRDRTGPRAAVAALRGSENRFRRLAES